MLILNLSLFTVAESALLPGYARPGEFESTAYARKLIAEYYHFNAFLDHVGPKEN